MKRIGCHARQYGDQMICAPCGLNWDVNDPEPPECRKHDGRSKVVKLVKEMEAPKAKPKGLPDTLPPHVADEMERAHKNGGMQAAYRIFLDRMEL